MIRHLVLLLAWLPLVVAGQEVDSLFAAGRMHYFNGQEQKGQQELSDVLQINPSYLEARQFLAQTYLWEGRNALAKTTLLPIRHLRDSTTISLFIELFVLEGQQDSAIHWIRSLEQINPTPKRTSRYLAQTLGLGDRFFVSQGKISDLLQRIPLESTQMDEYFLRTNWWHVGVDYLFDHFSNQPSFPRTQFAIRAGYRNAQWGNYQLRMSRAERFGLMDTQLEFEAYPKFGKKWYALVHAATSGGTLFPSTRWGLEPTASLFPNTEVAAGIRALHFNDFSIYLGTVAANYTHENSLWGLRFFLSNTSRSGNTVELLYRYAYRPSLSWLEARIAYGTSPANEFLDQRLAGLLNNSSASIQLAWEHSWGYRWSSRLQGQYNYQDPHPLAAFNVLSFSGSIQYRF